MRAQLELVAGARSLELARHLEDAPLRAGPAVRAQLELVAVVVDRGASASP